jgi:hypothetical protein
VSDGSNLIATQLNGQTYLVPGPVNKMTTGTFANAPAKQIVNIFLSQ